MLYPNNEFLQSILYNKNISKTLKTVNIQNLAQNTILTIKTKKNKFTFQSIVKFEYCIIRLFHLINPKNDDIKSQMMKEAIVSNPDKCIRED